MSGTVGNIKQPISCTVGTSNNPMSCPVGNVIHCITCQGCKEQYIGETHNLRAHVQLHKNHISSPIYRTMGVIEHITSCARNKDPCLPSCLFIKLKQRIESFRKKARLFYRKIQVKTQCITVILGHLGNIR